MDVIRELQELKDEHGNVEVIGVNEEEIKFEVQDDGGSVVIVAE
jgi:hypothetical protein